MISKLTVIDMTSWHIEWATQIPCTGFTGETRTMRNVFNFKFQTFTFVFSSTPSTNMTSDIFWYLTILTGDLSFPRAALFDAIVHVDNGKKKILFLRGLLGFLIFSIPFMMIMIILLALKFGCRVFARYNIMQRCDVDGTIPSKTERRWSFRRLISDFQPQQSSKTSSRIARVAIVVKTSNLSRGKFNF